MLSMMFDNVMLCMIL